MNPWKLRKRLGCYDEPGYLLGISHSWGLYFEPHASWEVLQVSNNLCHYPLTRKVWGGENAYILMAVAVSIYA